MPQYKNYSPGLAGVIAGISTICYIDPKTGHLLYRGYETGELARKATFEEVAHLLLKEHLPNKAELTKFDRHLRSQRKVPKDILDHFKTLPEDTHPMEALRSGVSSLGAHDHEAIQIDHESNVNKAIHLTAKMPSLVAAHSRIRQGKKPISPDKKLSHATNFLYMLSGKKPSKFNAEAMNKSLILYAEHEFNASTFTCRVIASTLSDYYSAITGGIGALKGPLHGGANEEAMKMLIEIDSPARAKDWVMDKLANHEKIMGFGHRVYKGEDTRATFMKEISRKLGKQTKQEKWMRMSQIIETTLAKEKKLHPNVDFYSATAYHLMGIPLDLYTPIFAIARVTGWSAHIIEQQDHNRIIRPRSIYEGRKNRKFIPLSKRR